MRLPKASARGAGARGAQEGSLDSPSQFRTSMRKAARGSRLLKRLVGAEEMQRMMVEAIKVAKQQGQIKRPDRLVSSHLTIDRSRYGDGENVTRSAVEGVVRWATHHQTAMS